MQKKKQRFKLNNNKIIVPIVMIVFMFAYFSANSEYFMTYKNIMSILREASVSGIVAIGAAFLMAAGEADLSVGGIVGLTTVLCGRFLDGWLLPLPLAILLVVLCGAVCGLINSILVEKLNVGSFIITLAMANVYKGATTLCCFRDAVRGTVTSKALEHTAINIFAKDIGGFYFVTIMFLVLVLIGQFVFKCTKYGINVYACGSNRKAAVLSGINVQGIRRSVFILCGACCGMAAVFTMARLKTVTPNVTSGMEFTAIAAVIIGGASLFGSDSGDTSAIGALVGAIFLCTVNNGVLKLDVPSAYQTVLQGIALILMLCIDALFGMIGKGAHKKELNETRESEA